MDRRLWESRPPPAVCDTAPSRRACPLGPGVGKAQVGSKKIFEEISVVADFCIEFFPRKVVNC